MAKRQDKLTTILSSATSAVPTHVKIQKLRSHSHLALTTVLQPKRALCDGSHRSAYKLCGPCKAAIVALRKFGTNYLSIGIESGLGAPLYAMMDNKKRGLGIRNSNANKHAMESLSSAFYYKGAAAELITSWKYRSMIELTDYIAGLITDASIAPPNHDIVTVILSHWKRRLTRGFDPVWLLANALMKHGVISRPTLILKPRRKLPYQHLKHRYERHIASSHFQVNKHVLAKRVLILDDVVTNSSTLNAAALALKDAGAKSVCGFTIASAERKPIALV